MFEAEEVIKRVDGLNNISTLHRWRKMVEELCGISFEQRTVQVGKTSYTKIYQFSEADVGHFQEVSILRNKGQPIKDAIIKVFEEEKTPEQNKTLIDNLIEMMERLNENFAKLSKESLLLKAQVQSIMRENYQLQGRIEELEMGKMDKPFQKKKS
ncbi:hypothetical protein [Enterococcus ratti]|uniref:Uncharacterized protein n=1 Tax=Enterococcus ratti TaxID=150033 RepID=A0A1L8WR40_9ENTE|nr:hypothetical protein [Enterococcus ratti]OJG83504.1 hypothetical protein RV14_GL001382 [Enterococcus ratti]